MGSAERDQEILTHLKANLPDLRALLAEMTDHRPYEDGIYRFYHGSFKVYWVLQPATERIVDALRAAVPDAQLNPLFVEIVSAGTGKTFESEHNQAWLAHTGPIVTAFFHARFMLEMAVKYATELDAPPQPMPSGWATVLYLYASR